jgi:glycosyltransferase involved in cell wall biosynthesis
LGSWIRCLILAEMDWGKTCAVVIPCFNEEAAISRVVAGAVAYLPRVVVVDDGSTDRTGPCAADAGAEVISLATNSGKGTALRFGSARALELNCTWMIHMDGDGQHLPSDIPAFLECAARTGASLVVGDRMHQAESLPWLRRLVNQWMSRRLSAYTGQPLVDSQCGYRLVNVGVWSKLDLRTRRFEIESELAVGFARGGHHIEFVPIQVVTRGTRSHINPLTDAIRWWSWWLGLRRE